MAAFAPSTHTGVGRVQIDAAPPQPVAAADIDGRVPRVVNEALASPGRALDAAVRSQMEARFGYDFSSVRVHTDPSAHASATAVGAHAYTVNRDMVFGPNTPRPESPSGRRLLVHELAHIVQRAQSPGTAGRSAEADRDADRVAAEFGAHPRALRVGQVAPGVLARQQIAGSQVSAATIRTVTESGRTVIIFNGVPIAETQAAEADVVLTLVWTPQRMAIRVAVPEGRDVFLIKGAAAKAALDAAASRHHVEVGQIGQAPTSGGEVQLPSPPPFRITDSLSGERQKPAGPTPTVPPKTPRTQQKPPDSPPATTPAPTAIPAPAGPPLQLFRPSPPSLDLSPEAKYGKPPTDDQIAAERIKGIIRDAMAGKPGVPPPIAGASPLSLLDITKKVVADAVKPLIRGLPKDLQTLVLDKLDSAVESGVKGVLESVLDNTKLDATTKGAILRAADAGMRVK
jgi:hypothetical protein